MSVAAHGSLRATLLAVTPPGLFRLLLAMAVVVSHISALEIGRLAVMLFFFLSGYWVTNIWFRKFGPSHIWRFYAARYLRVAPLFLLVTLFAAWLRGWPLHFVNFSLFGLASTDADPTGVSWSLDVEMQFYLLFPLIILALGRLPMALNVVLVAGLVGLGVWLDTVFGVQTVLKFLVPFVLGALTFTLAWRPSLAQAHLSLLAFAAMSGLTALTPFISKRAAHPFDTDIWAIIWMLPLLPYVARSLMAPSSRLDRHLGNLSFPLYLVHFAFVAAATGAFPGIGWVKYAAALAACAFAVVLYRFVDRPIDAWRVALTERQGG